ncbi:L-asparaginase [Zancudomyces culisetae]|uniref:asparaginase n=1 Tax=Zancudomyces culisetae TaxID=1213189 RepID=A0A1R1PRZ4_ZANCU|nr:L-asparaginase [Zancudomyces culisetae]|eukprot:OMH83756.1 L-asparaginase [Zancudomyces culisetae]
MVNSSESGYKPENGFLSKYLRSQQRFFDPDGLNEIRKGTNSLKTRTSLMEEVENYIERKGSESIEGKAQVDEQVDEEGLEEWLVTPKMIHGKRIVAGSNEARNQTLGTDTMAYTASAISFMLKNLGKTVILTGSQVPISEVRNDAVENLLGALIIAGHYIIPEVTLYFNNHLYRGNRVSKVDALNFSAFDSPNMPPLVKVGVNIAPPMKGVVLETFGCGNIPCKDNSMIDLLREASDRGVVIVNVTQCQKGNVTNLYETARGLVESGVVPGGDMTSECALTKLSYLLGLGRSASEIRKLVSQSIRGELTVITAVQPTVVVDPKVRAASFVQYVCYEIINNKRGDDKFLTETHGEREHLDVSLQLSDNNTILTTESSPLIDDGDIASKNGVKPNSAVAMIENPPLPHTPTESSVAKSDLALVNSTLGQRKSEISQQERSSVYKSFFPVLLCAAASTNDIMGMTMLSIASEGWLETTCYDYNGRTPLHCAARGGNIQAAKWLLKKGASVHVLDGSGHTPLFEAVVSRRADLINLMIQAGGHFSNSEYSDLLFQAYEAITQSDLEFIRLLVLARIDINRPDAEGRTLLHIAVQFNQPEIVGYLLTLKNVNVIPLDKLDREPYEISLMVVSKYRNAAFLANGDEAADAYTINELLARASGRLP